MPKTYLATQSEVAAVEQKADDANTAINAADTGLSALNTTVDTIQTTQQADDTRIADLETAVGDASSGLVKSVTDLDTQINEVGTGIVARVEDLEQGGTATTKIRTHSASGAYEDGEVVVKDIAEQGVALYKANGAIDGSTTPVPFVVGSGANTWSKVVGRTYNEDLVYADLQAAGGGTDLTATITRDTGGGLLMESVYENPTTTPPTISTQQLNFDHATGHLKYSDDYEGPTRAAVDDNCILTRGENSTLYAPISSTTLTRFYTDDTSGTAYTQFMSLGGISVEGRFNTSSTLTCRIVNNTGSACELMWSAINSDDTVDSGSISVANGGNFPYNRESTASSARFSETSIWSTTGQCWRVTLHIFTTSGTAGVRVVGTISTSG